MDVDTLFGDLDAASLTELQASLDALGLNSEEAIARLVAGGDSGAEFLRLVQHFTKGAGSPSTAILFLKKWLQKQKELQEKMAELKKKRLRPIWRCGVCGRANLPYIVCYVAPGIVGYDEVDG